MQKAINYMVIHSWFDFEYLYLYYRIEGILFYFRGKDFKEIISLINSIPKMAFL
jgi:hypothetical protein